MALLAASIAAVRPALYIDRDIKSEHNLDLANMQTNIIELFCLIGLIYV